MYTLQQIKESANTLFGDAANVIYANLHTIRNKPAFIKNQAVVVQIDSGKGTVNAARFICTLPGIHEEAKFQKA